MVGFTPGELFESFHDIQQKLADYSEEHFCHFYIKDSKKLTPEETVNPYLIYKHIVYSCIYGGQKARFRGSGNRSVTSIRHGCGSSLYLRVTKDRNHLQVRSFCDNHNHDISEELYRAASQDRKLPWDLRAEVEELLLLGADKDRLIDYIRHVSCKVIDKKNLFNMYETAVRQQREISRERAVMLIQKVYGVDTEDEADQILTQLLETTKPPRKNRKAQIIEHNEDSVQYTYINEGEETPVDDEVSEELQRIMGTMEGSEAERIVIVQDDEQYEVIEADPSMEAEYLEEEEREPGELLVKQEMNKDVDDEMDAASNASSRFTTRRFVPHKKPPAPIVNTNFRIGNKRANSPDHLEPPSKTRAISNSVEDNGLHTLESEQRVATLKVEQEKLAAEMEMIKLKRNKLVREISKIDLEKSNLYLEIDLFKTQKRYFTEKIKMTELTNEKLRLEIAKLKVENGSISN